ncbi:MAG: type II toxin-antitoxin system RelE/ParE family toxin [Candidatus ainarchaeum sp.]|nr:type II toxin-antitoxin system RelE/ParE family toxin [Candidatus ainarchaeum sp.]
MTWLVLISEKAKKDFYSLDNINQKRIKKSFEELKENPYKKRPNADIKKLVGSHDPELYRLRFGDERIIYSINENKVLITRILPRKNAYKWLD